MQDASLLTSGAFAKRAGVTVRTLRFYDRLGLLRPREHTEAGYRLYGAAELIRLQQVMTLKYIGFSLEEIRRILEDPAFDLVRALRVQRRIVSEKTRQMQTIVRAIDGALHALAQNENAWDPFTSIITAVTMENDNTWPMKYYTEEDRAKLAARPAWTAEDQKQAEAEWGALGARATELARAGADPAGQEAQELAARWMAMVGQFTQGDPGLQAGLQQVWANRQEMPAQHHFVDDDVYPFIGQMLAAYQAGGR